MSLLDTEIGDEPLDYRPATTSFPLIPEEMVASIALGMEDDLIVSARHGFTVEQWRQIEAQPWFQTQVAVKRAEYEKNGVTFKAKAAWMASDLLDQVYLQVSSNEASLAQKHDVLKTLIKAGGLEPKDEKAQQTGPTFQINIDLGAGQSISLSNAVQPPPVIDVETKEVGE